MDEPRVDADEVAEMVAERASSEEKRARRERMAADAKLADSVPSARSRWRFGVELHETSEGDTLVIRCYPRKLAFTEDDGPFALGWFGWLARGVAVAIVAVVSWVAEDWRLALGLFGVLTVGLVYAHYARTVRIHITRLGQFVIYEQDPKHPIGIGPTSDLRMRAPMDSDYMDCSWADNGKSFSHNSFGLRSLRRADWLTIERFIAKHHLP